MKITATIEFDDIDQAVRSLGVISENEIARKSGGPKGPAGVVAAAAVAKVNASEPSLEAQAFAQANNIDIKLVPGSGKSGRVTMRDLKDYLAKRTASTPSPVTLTQPPVPPSAPAPAPAPVPPAASVAAPESSGITFEQMNAKMEAVYKTGGAGLAKCQDIVTKCGVKRVREIKPEQYEMVVKECDAVLAAHAAAGA